MFSQNVYIKFITRIVLVYFCHLFSEVFVVLIQLIYLITQKKLCENIMAKLRYSTFISAHNHYYNLISL